MILITGASGYLGGHLVAASGGVRCVALTGKRPLNSDAARHVTAEHAADLADAHIVRELLDRYSPSAVIHCAALADAKQCELDPDAARRANVDATRNLLQQLSRETLFIQVSTDLVFDGIDAPPGGIDETVEPAPRSVYARTKWEAEQLAFGRGGRTVVLRSSLIYGPPSGEQQGVLGWMRSALESRTPLTLFTDEFRTPVFVGDLVELIFGICRTSLGPETAVLHAGGPSRCSRYELGQQFARALGIDNPLLAPLLRAELPLIPPRPRDVSLRSDRSFARYGITPTSLESGLSRSVADHR